MWTVKAGRFFPPYEFHIREISCECNLILINSHANYSLWLAVRDRVGSEWA